MDIARVTITLMEVHKKVRRVVEVPLGVSLADLHLIIQAAMGWQNSHLYEFHDGRRIYGTSVPGWSDPDYRVTPAAKTRLAELMTAAKRRIGYVYDMGDDWQHRLDIVRLGEAAEGVAYPRLVEAKGRCPPEDVGGFPGFEQFLEAINDPRHPEHRALREWYGAGFDPKDADEPAIGANLARLAARLARKAQPRAAKIRKPVAPRAMAALDARED